VALGTIAVILGVLVPTLLPLFRDTGRAPPAVLAAADSIAVFCATHWPFLIALCAIVCLMLVAIVRRPGFRLAVDRLVLSLPVISKLVEQSNLSMFATTLGTLLANGVPLVAALHLTSSVATNSLYRVAISAAAKGVEEGAKLADAIAATGIFPPLAVRFVGIGEEASHLDSMLRHLGQLLDKSRRQTVRRLMTLLTPTITVIVGVLVGGLILSVMQAILSVNELAIR
jgi:general secretion pathway protein F